MHAFTYFTRWPKSNTDLASPGMHSDAAGMVLQVHKTSNWANDLSDGM